jgi:hypothetical protein
MIVTRSNLETSRDERHVDAVTEVLSATGPADLFHAGLSSDELKKRYRKLKRQVHPDRFANDHKDRAEEAFNRLTELWDELNGTSRRPASSAYTFSTKAHTYVFGDVLFKDAMSTVYSAEYRDEDLVTKVMVRFAQTPADNMALENHAKTIKKLNAEVPADLGHFHPYLVDFARHRDAATAVERVVVVTNEVPFSDDTPLTYVDLLSVYSTRLKALMPIEARDMAWIFRRLLVALGTAHDVGVSCRGGR